MPSVDRQTTNLDVQAVSGDPQGLSGWAGQGCSVLIAAQCGSSLEGPPVCGQAPMLLRSLSRSTERQWGMEQGSQVLIAAQCDSVFIVSLSGCASDLGGRQNAQCS